MVTAIVALWGAALSTFSFLRTRRDQRARLKVVFGPAITENPKTPKERVVCYGVFVNNVGLRDVHFGGYRAYIRIEGVDEDLHFEPPDDAPRMPAVLKPGDSFTAHLMRADFHRLVKQKKGDVTTAKIKGGVVDAVDQKFSSKWIRIEAIDTSDMVQMHGLFDV